jgi:hypothetical protein
MSETNGNGAGPDHSCCGDCRHWTQLATDPLQVDKVRGMCTESPPQMYVLGPRLIRPAYPTVPPDWLACSRFAQRLVAVGG